MKVIAAGGGPGALEFYTGAVLEAVKNADVVLTAQRLSEPLVALNKNVQVMGITETVNFLNEHASASMNVCVIASGDTGFYSIASTLSKRLAPEIHLEFLCGIGSLSYFCAKVKCSYENMKLVSLHGRGRSIVPFVCYNRKVFALTGGELKAHTLIRQLVDAGLADVTVHVGENLSSDHERIVSGTAAELAELVFDDLSVMIVENPKETNRYAVLKDSDFLRGKSPMTKEAIRNLSVAALEIEPTDVVYDIGAGTGSVTCAMALKASESTVYAVEKNAEAVELVLRNMEKTGAKNICIRQAFAPEGLEEFPPADKVFIGGSTGNLREIMEHILTKNPSAVFVVTAVTLETISQSIDVMKELNMETEITCANISTAQKLGRYHLMKAENPVYIIKGARIIES